MTATDLQQYLGVIDHMKSLLQTADFDEVFSLLTTDMPKSKQFLLKMELKRMAQPCNYFIDLRGHVSGNVKAYTYQGNTHYMDDNAIRVFEKGLKQYGSYTVGLYEEVLNTENNFRVIHRKETEDRIKKALNKTSNGEHLPDEDENLTLQIGEIIPFGHYQVRQDERMHFSIEVDMQFQNGRIIANTSDLSVSGCKIKLAQPIDIHIGDEVRLYFTKLEQQYVLKLKDGVAYKVVDTEIKGSQQFLRLQRLTLDDDTQFAEFLERFITSNKRRYKVNLDSACETLRIKGYEQFFLPRLNSLPVFIAVQEGKPLPLFALTTDHNKAIWHYFLDEQHQAVFDSIFSVKRLKQLLAQESETKSTILYSFTHAAKGKLYFYCATSEELAASEPLKEIFLGFGSSKPSWRVFHLELLSLNPQNAETAFTVPEEYITKTAKLSPLVKGLIKNLRYAINIHEINSINSAFWYQSYPVEQKHLKLLASFAHKKRADKPICEAIAMQYVNLRSESRYLYKTPLTLFSAQKPMSITGHSRDFSSRGLQVETEQPVSFSKGDIVYLQLPELQKITKNFVLSNLAYEIMAISKSHTIMNLRAVENDTPHTGRLFFQRLIQNNRAKLTLAEESPKYPKLAHALRNLFILSNNCFAMFIHRKGIRYEISTVAKSQGEPSIFQLLTLQHPEISGIDLSLLLRNNAAVLHFAQQLKQMKRQDSAKTFELFINVPSHSMAHESPLLARYDYEFNTEQEKQQFVLDALQTGCLFAFKLSLSRASRPDTDYIAPELNYINAYAMHKAKAVEEELWSVTGIIDVVDISAEIGWRYGANFNPIQNKEEQNLLLNPKLN